MHLPSGVDLSKYRIFETEEFRQRVKFLRESQWWPRERLESYQRQQLRELMSHVYERMYFHLVAR